MPKLLLFTGLLIAMYCTSCSHYFYKPPEPHALMLSEKGDVKVLAGAGSSSSSNTHFVVQAGWSPIKHLAVSGSYFQVGQLNNDNISNDRYISSFSLEGAIGGYLTKEMKENNKDRTAKKSNSIILDAYAGYGRRGVTNQYFNGGEAMLKSQHYFLQGGIHYQNPFIGLSFNLRAVHLDFTEGEVIGNVSDNLLVDLTDLNNDPFTFLESSVRIKAGGPKVKGFISRNWMTPPFGGKRLVYSSSSWNIGFTLDLQDMFEKEGKR